MILVRVASRKTMLQHCLSTVAICKTRSLGTEMPKKRAPVLMSGVITPSETLDTPLSKLSHKIKQTEHKYAQARIKIQNKNLVRYWEIFRSVSDRQGICYYSVSDGQGICCYSVSDRQGILVTHNYVPKC